MQTRTGNIGRLDYGEILFVGQCNFRCFYCLGNEMHCSAKNTNNFSTPFTEWRNFYTWLDDLKHNGVKKIYLSSTNCEPLLYKHLPELIDFLKNSDFIVGIRTNASLDISVCDKCDSVSMSLQSLNAETFKKITGVNLTFDFLDKLKQLKNDNVRVTIVVNRYNYLEVLDMLDALRPFNLRYVQLRQCYKYYDVDITPDIDAFNYVLNELKDFSVIDNFNESIIYDVHGLRVSIWKTVFSKDSISSSNYFTNGVITKNNLLVEGYEDGRTGLL